MKTLTANLLIELANEILDISDIDGEERKN